jgi:PAS domain S-box-containing protein
MVTGKPEGDVVATIGIESTQLTRDFLSGGGELGALMRSKDWSSTKLGPINGWPQSLRTSVSTCLNSRFAILVWWGPDLIMLYNDAYRDIIAAKHPAALGKPGRECWPEVWDTIGPMLEGVLQRGEATWSDDLLLMLARHGYPEECYFTFSYSPISSESGGVGGVFTPVMETTERVINERRSNTLRELATSSAEVKSEETMWAVAAEILGRNRYDFSFSILYALSPDAKYLHPKSCNGISPDHVLCQGPKEMARLDSPMLEAVGGALNKGAMVLVNHVENLELPAGVWGIPPVQALALPVVFPGHQSPTACILLGLNARKKFDQDYSLFLDILSRQLASNLAAARAHEEERKRLEMLAELDRAKTVFYSNVSHELRTPLTLILGPVEAMLERPQPSVMVERNELQLVHRNSMRLLKLVNTLLDFSRIEAGRIRAVYEPTDLAALTADTASAFRSAMEQAGLEFHVYCPPLAEPAYVDRDMWEKIILNLISNAFKFTLNGHVTVRLAEGSERIELQVEDSGLGIPEDQQSKVFERFHRLEGVRGRTHEGTGIGLALVQELVRLHHGSIRVESAVGKGSTFVVSIPKGRAHLPQVDSQPRTLKSTGVSASAYVEEALRWLPESDSNIQLPPVFASDSVQAPHLQTTTGRILLADDNADMRGYVRRLLGDNYEVRAVSNGTEALAEIRGHPPDLVLTDVMMPGLDGFGLLREIRADESTKTIPVILLSARAGEDARIEGMQAGADDYMVKPFTARELLARVGAHLAMGRLRRESAEHERALRSEAETAHQRTATILESISDSFFALDRDWLFTYANASAERTLKMTRDQLVGRNFWDVFPLSKGTNLETQFSRAMAERVSVRFENYYEPWKRWYEIRLYPSGDGGISVFYQDSTERKQIEVALQESREELERRVEQRTSELQLANQELRELSSRLQQMQDEERRRLARELHDSAGQLLAAIAMNIAVVQSEAHNLSMETAARVSDNAAMVDQLSTEIRTLSHLLHPPLLDEVGLSSALRWYIEGFEQRSKISASLEMPDRLDRYPAEIEIAIFRAVQECLTNIHRHSGTSTCSILVFLQQGNLHVEVRDEGKGIPREKRAMIAKSGGGVGLRGMQERIRQLGGILTIRSSDAGTAVEVILPIAQAIITQTEGAA